MSDKPRRTEGTPHDKLTRLTAVMTDALEADAEFSDEIRCIVFLADGKRSGIQLHGYDRDTEAMADLLVYLTKIFEANGKTLLLAPLRQG